MQLKVTYGTPSIKLRSFSRCHVPGFKPFFSQTLRSCITVIWPRSPSLDWVVKKIFYNLPIEYRQKVFWGHIPYLVAHFWLKRYVEMGSGLGINKERREEEEINKTRERNDNKIEEKTRERKIKHKGKTQKKTRRYKRRKTAKWQKKTCAYCKITGKVVRLPPPSRTNLWCVERRGGEVVPSGRSRK